MISSLFRAGLPGDKSTWEVILEYFGAINALQRYRWDWYKIHTEPNEYPFYLKKPPKKHDFSQFLDAEIIACEVVQKELYVRECLERLQRENAFGNAPDIEKLEEELAALNEQYWAAEESWWHWRSEFPEGPLTRGFELWRLHPQWYLHPVLRDDCAKKGGCCARDCGCCLHRPIPMDRRLGAGHCTPECGCCRKVRRFDLTAEQRKKKKMQFQFIPHTGDGFGVGDYYRRTYLASIFGLWASSNENPFSLIDGFLRREQMKAGGFEAASSMNGGNEEEGREQVEDGGSEAASLMEAGDEDESESTVLI